MSVKYEGEILSAIKQVLPEVDFSKIEGDVTPEAIAAAKADVLVTKDVHTREINAAVGRVTGSSQTVFGRILGDAAKGKEYKDLLPLVEAKFTEVAGRIKELEEAAPSGLTDKEKKELVDLRKLTGEQTEALAKKDEEIATVRTKAREEVEQQQLSHELDTDFESLTWIDDINPYAKKGLRIELDNKYAFKRVDGKRLVFDKEGGVVRNTNGTGQMEAKELFEKYAKDAKLYKMNGAVVAGAQGGKTPPPQTGQRQLSPEELAHVQKMRDYAKGGKA